MPEYCAKLIPSLYSLMNKTPPVCWPFIHAGQLEYSRIKPKQLEAVIKFCQGQDRFASHLTATEKCWFMPFCLQIFNTICGQSSSIAVVLSPLVALMAEQMRRFLPISINAEFLGDLQTDDAISRVVQSQCELVLVSSENLCYNWTSREMLLSLAYIENLVALVVNEVHCVSTW